MKINEILPTLAAATRLANENTEGANRHCPGSYGSILSIVPISEEVAERANARYQWQLKDWNENFRHHMDFNEYHYRGKLNADVAAGHIGKDQALDLLEKYTQSNSKSSRSVSGSETD